MEIYRFIKQLLNEEKAMNANYDLENQAASQREAENLAKQLEEEYLKDLDEEEKLNMPECKICFDKIEYDDLDPLAWGHMFHGGCLEPYIRLKIEDKNSVNNIGKLTASFAFLKIFELRSSKYSTSF